MARQWIALFAAGVGFCSMNIAVPARAAMIYSDTAQVNALDLNGEFYVQLKSGVRCAARSDGYCFVPVDGTTAGKLSAILLAMEKSYIVNFLYDTANCRVSHVDVCPRTTGSC